MEELFGIGLHIDEVKDLGLKLKRLKVEDDAESDLKLKNNQCEDQLILDQNNPIYIVLCQRKKGQRLSWEEKVYIYSKLKENNINKKHLMQSFSISHTTLLKIKNELDEDIISWSTKVKPNKKQIMRSSYINKYVNKYINITKHPYTAREVSTFLFSNAKIRVSPRWVRGILSENMNMSYKLGKSRLTNYNEINASLMKTLFSIKISKVMNDYDALINIDKTSFSRLTMATRSWSQKGKETKLNNIWFSASISLITGITTFGDVFASSIKWPVTSKSIIEYLSNLDNFLRRKTNTTLSNWLLIMDNASVHRSKEVKEFI